MQHWRVVVTVISVSHRCMLHYIITCRPAGIPSRPLHGDMRHRDQPGLLLVQLDRQLDGFSSSFRRGQKHGRNLRDWATGTSCLNIHLCVMNNGTRCQHMSAGRQVELCPITERQYEVVSVCV